MKHFLLIASLGLLLGACGFTPRGQQYAGPQGATAVGDDWCEVHVYRPLASNKKVAYYLLGVSDNGRSVGHISAGTVLSWRRRPGKMTLSYYSGVVGLAPSIYVDQQVFELEPGETMCLEATGKKAFLQSYMNEVKTERTDPATMRAAMPEAPRPEIDRLRSVSPAEYRSLAPKGATCLVYPDKTRGTAFEKHAEYYALSNTTAWETQSQAAGQDKQWHVLPVVMNEMDGDHIWFSLSKYDELSPGKHTVTMRYQTLHTRDISGAISDALGVGNSENKAQMNARAGEVYVVFGFAWSQGGNYYTTPQVVSVSDIVKYCQDTLAQVPPCR